MSTDPHEMLGRQVVYEILGADAAKGPSFDFGSLFSAAAEAATKGVDYAQAQSAANAANAAQDDKLKKAIAADSAWADAETTLDVTKQGGDASKIAAASSLASAMQAAAISTAAGLDADRAGKRLEAAQKMANTASQNALNNSSNAAAQSKMRAWQKVLAGVASASSAPSTALTTSPDSALLAKHGFSGGKGDGNFFTQKFGGVPMWGWMAGGAVVLTGVALLLRRRG